MPCKISRAGCGALLGWIGITHLAVVPILGKTIRPRSRSSRLQRAEDALQIKEEKPREKGKERTNPIP